MSSEIKKCSDCYQSLRRSESVLDLKEQKMYGYLMEWYLIFKKDMVNCRDSFTPDTIQDAFINAIIDMRKIE